MSSKVTKDQESIPYQALLDENHTLLDENHVLKDEVESLRARLEEAEELKRAISEGDLDALVMPAPEGELIFTLDSADRAYRVLVETMNEGTATLAYDGTILYCNRHFAKLLKMPPHVIVGTSIYRFIAPENTNTFKALLKQEIGKGEINLLSGENMSLPAYLSISSLKSEGSPNAWCLVVTDLTEQKKSEEILASERLARSIIEQAAEAIVVCDTSGRIIRFSDAMPKLCGCDPTFQQFEDLINLRFSAGANVGESTLPVSSALKGFAILGMEATFELKDFQKLHLLLNSGPLKNADGEIIGCVVTLTDITERKQAEESLRQAYEEIQIQSEELQAQAEELQEANEALSESEKRYRLLFDHSMDAIILTDPRGDGKILSANPAAYRLLGWSEEELIGKERNVMFDPEDPAILTLLDERAQSGSARMQVTYRRKDGTKFIGELSTALFTDINGEPRAVAIIRDITKRKRAEAETQKLMASVQQEKERLSALVKSIPDEVWFADNQKKVTLVNPVVLKKFGNSTFNNPDVEAIAGSLEVYRPDGTLRPVEEAPLLRALKGELIINQEEIIRTPVSGELRFRQVNAVPVKDASGIIIGSVSVIRDITERKQAEEALRESQAKLEAAIESMTDAVFVSDIEGNFVNFNDAFVKFHRFHSKKECYRKFFKYYLDIFEGYFLDGTLAPADMWPVRRALRGETATDAELIVRRKDTGETWIASYSFAPIRDKDGVIIGSVVVARDITERKKLEEQIRQRAEELETVMEVAPVAIWIGHDPQSHDITGNRMANEFYEAEVGENVSANVTPVRRFFYKGHELTADELPMQQASLNDIDVRNAEFDVLLPSGEYRALLGSASPLHDAEGHVRGSVGAFIDITKRKEAEAKLKDTLDNLDKLVKERTSELEEAYESLLENEIRLNEAQKIAHLGNWDWDVLTNKLYWSDEVYRIYGLDPLESGITYDSFLNYVHPDDRDYVNNADKKALNGKPYSIDYRIISVDGQGRIVHSQGEAVFDEKNTPVRARGIVQDITERKQIEEALRKSKEQYQTLFNSISEGFAHYKAIYDEHGNLYDILVLEINPSGAKLSGVEQEAQIGKTWREVWPDVEDHLFEIYNKVDQTGKSIQFEGFSNITGRWYVSQIDIIEKGQFAVTFRDITERKITEEALEKINKTRIKEIHHRIKNNLQVICSLLSLEAERLTDTKMLEAFKESQNRVASIAQIHEELYKGTGTDNLDFAAYLRKLTADLFCSYNLRNDDISLNLDLEQVYLGMDIAIPLGIIVNELVSNSLKHAFSAVRRGEIQINLSKREISTSINNISDPDGDCPDRGDFDYILTVADNGNGILEEIDFQNADSLGLQLVNILVEQIDGYIELKRDRGTEFVILFSDIEE